MLKVTGSVLHLRKELLVPPVERFVAGVEVRSIRVPEDIGAWLELRKRATAGLKPRVRDWTDDDFAAEMLENPWWREEASWIAAADDSSIIGAVTLGVRTGSSRSVAIVHWLLVDPALRRRGVGRMLLSHLERAAWDAGWREIELETHAKWMEAVAFYHSMGYAAVRDRSPR
jgi:GNAT superfamily N-acetyltransferase